MKQKMRFLLLICLKCSNDKKLPASWKLFGPKGEYFQNIFMQHEKNGLFATALSCCEMTGAYQYETSLYPVYLILKTYIGVYPELSFLELVYNGTSIRLSSEKRDGNS